MTLKFRQISYVKQFEQNKRKRAHESVSCLGSSWWFFGKLCLRLEFEFRINLQFLFSLIVLKRTKPRPRKAIIIFKYLLLTFYLPPQLLSNQCFSVNRSDAAKSAKSPRSQKGKLRGRQKMTNRLKVDWIN